MKVIRVQYDLNYVHLLTFNEAYKSVVAPFFGLTGLQYAIDNEGTMLETLRLTLPSNSMAFWIRKEGLTFLFEGDLEELKDANGPLKIFWDIFEKIKTIPAFKWCTAHTITMHAVEIMDKEKVDAILVSPPVFRTNPFGKLEEFLGEYQYKDESKYYTFSFGNYSKKDILTHQLRPFRTEYTQELKDAVGVMCKLMLKEEEKNVSFGKFKHLLHEGEKIIKEYKWSYE